MEVLVYVVSTIGWFFWELLAAMLIASIVHSCRASKYRESEFRRNTAVGSAILASLLFWFLFWLGVPSWMVWWHYVITDAITNFRPDNMQLLLLVNAFGAFFAVLVGWGALPVLDRSDRVDDEVRLRLS